MTALDDQTVRPSARIRRLGSAIENRPWVFLVIAWIGGAAFVASRLNQRWYPHDDGSFAQSASRVLEGQLPHRDFAELYTGGMTFLNAGMFWLFGQNLIWLRVPMFALFIGFLPVVYAIARRFVSPPIACLVTLFAVAWSVPSYPAAVPSWYVLFFTTFGAYCAIRYFETKRLLWLLSAGIFGGLAISFKIVGIWYVIAVILTLTIAATSAPDSQGLDVEDRRKRPLDHLIAAAVGAVALAIVVNVFGSRLGAAELVNLLIPAAVLCCMPFALVVTNVPNAVRDQISVAVVTIGIFLVGVAAPLVIVAIPYLVTHSLGDLATGVLVSPRSRLEFAYYATPSPRILLVAVPVLAALLCRPISSSRLKRVIDVGVVTALVVMLLAGENEASRALLWNLARSLAPLIIVVGAVGLIVRRGIGLNDPRTMAVVLLVSIAGFASLTQFPFGAAVYFCYVAPLVLLAAVATIRHLRIGSSLLPTALLLTLTVFGFLFVDGTSDLGGSFRKDRSTVILDDERASIRVSTSDRATYRRVDILLQRHASGRFVFAGPDAPEVYFLSAFENPTKSLFDFLDTSGSARGTALLSTLKARGVSVVAINLRPGFSDPLGGAVASRLRAEYPEHERVGRFDVRWRR